MIDLRLWIAWAAGGVLWAVWFAVMEGIAIANGPKSPDTLSQRVWSLDLPAVFWFSIGGLAIGFVIWLTLHFFSKGTWDI